MFRVFQESLTNIARHADATEVRIGLERHDGRLILRMKDNGKGIEGEKLGGRRSLGIVGMQERVRLLNGKLSIDGTWKGNGCEFRYSHEPLRTVQCIDGWSKR